MRSFKKYKKMREKIIKILKEDYWLSSLLYDIKHFKEDLFKLFK